MTMPAFPAFNPKNATSNRRHKAAMDMTRRLIASLPADFVSDEQFAQLPPSVSPGTIDVEGYAPNIEGVLPAIPAAPSLGMVPPALTQSPSPVQGGTQLPFSPVLTNVGRFEQSHAYPTRKPITANPALFPFQAPAVPDALPDVPIRDTREEAKRALLGSGIAAALTALTGGNAGDAFAAYAGGAGQANEGLERQRQFNYENLIRNTQGQNDRAQAQVNQANGLQEKRLDDAAALDRLNEQGFNNDVDAYNAQYGLANRADIADENNKQKASDEQMTQEGRFFQGVQRALPTLGDSDRATQVRTVQNWNARARQLGIKDPATGELWQQPIPGQNGVPYFERSARGANQDAGTVLKSVQAVEAPKRTQIMAETGFSQNQFRTDTTRQKDRGLDLQEVKDAAQIAIAQGRLGLDQMNSETKNAISWANLGEYKKRTDAYVKSFNYYGLGGQGQLGKQALSLEKQRFAMSNELNRMRQLKSNLINGKNGNDVRQRELDERKYPELKAARQDEIERLDGAIVKAQQILDATPQALPVPQRPALPKGSPQGRSIQSDMPPLDNVPSANYTAPVTGTPNRNGNGFTINSLRNGTAPAPASRSSLPAVPRNAPPPTQHHSVSQRRKPTGQFDGPPAKANTSKMSNAEFGRYLAQRLAAKFGTKK